MSTRLCLLLISLVPIACTSMPAAEITSASSDDAVIAQQHALEASVHSPEAAATVKDWARLDRKCQELLKQPYDRDLMANNSAVIPLGYYSAACAHARLGDIASALTALEAAITSGYADPQAIAGDADLNALHQIPHFHELLDAAGRRSQEHTETGRLFLPRDRIIDLGNGRQGFLRPEDHHRIALLVPATPQVRERVLILECSAQQREQLTSLMASDTLVRLTGSGGVVEHGNGWELKLALSPGSVARAVP